MSPSLIRYKKSRKKNVGFREMVFCVTSTVYCHWCKKIVRREEATTDHVQPTAEGGSNSYLNMVISCVNCNCVVRSGDLSRKLNKGKKNVGSVHPSGK